MILKCQDYPEAKYPDGTLAGVAGRIDDELKVGRQREISGQLEIVGCFNQVFVVEPGTKSL